MGNITIQGDLTGDVPGGEVGGASNLTTVGAIPYVSAAGILNQDPTALFWDAANNRLGVGTASPAQAVQVVGSVQVGGSSAFNNRVDFVSDSRSISWSLRGGGAALPGMFELYDNTAATSRMAFATTGNLLIGTTTDDGTNKLQVLGSIYSTAGFASYTNDGVFGVNARPFVLGHPGGQQTRIGYFSTGDGNYAGRMAFSSTSTGTAYSFIGNGDQGAYGALVMGASNSEAARFAPTTRNLLIGTTTDSNFKLDVAASGTAGTARFYGGAGVSNTTKVVVQAGAGDGFGNWLTEWQNSGGTRMGGVQFLGGSVAQISGLGYFSGGLSVPIGSAPNFSNAGFMFSATASAGSGTYDLSLSRASAGVLQVGDGGSNANGTVSASVFSLAAGLASQFRVSRRDTGNPAFAIYSSTGDLQFYDYSLPADVLTLNAGGTMTLYNSKATTGVTKAVIRAGAGQSTTSLTEWQNASTGAVLAKVRNDFAFEGVAFYAVSGGGVTAGFASTVFDLPSVNIIAFSNSATNGFATKDTGLSRSSAGLLEINSGTAGTYRDLILRRSQHNGVTVADLPTAAAGNAGSIQYVTDANDTTIGSTVAGGGANKVMVWSDGAAWKIFAS